MENIKFEVYREDKSEKTVRLALEDGKDYIRLVTKKSTGELEYTLIKLNKATRTFCLIERVGAETGLLLDEKGRVLVYGFND